MCGIFGYIGQKKNATKAVFEGLKRLDYRGYDSWGIAIQNKSLIKIEKHAGKISEALPKLPKSSIAIGHTRWATHGAVNDINAHPHISSNGEFALAHNGIVENYQEIKKSLAKKKYKFLSQTDTEVIVRLIEEKSKSTKNLEEAVMKAFSKLEGRNTIIILAKDGRIIGARNGSPLVIGINGKDKSEIYLSSDTLSFAPFVKNMVIMNNGEMVVCKPNELKINNTKSGKAIPYKIEPTDIQNDKVSKENFPHFMLKEIFEAPLAISQIVKQDHQAYFNFAKAIKKAKRVFAIGSGTAGVAAAQIAFYLRTFGKIPALSLVGSDSREYYELFDKDTLLIAPSQSGETADVLEVLEAAKERGAKVSSFVNMPGSMMTRMSDYKFMAQAGPEICVVSTKIFVSQLAWGYLVSKYVQGKHKEGLQNLKSFSLIIKKYLKARKNHLALKKIAKGLIKSQHIFLLSKAENFQITREGMVKIIESSYIHAHAIPSGDLKHYAITIMEEGIPVIVVVANDNVRTDILNAASEVKARGAQVIGVAPKKHDNFDLHIQVPDSGEGSAIINIIPIQLLAYYMATTLGHDVDKPRNIAKSVTVK